MEKVPAKTKYIGVREFRKNFAMLRRSAIKQNTRYVVMYHNEPVLEIRALDKKKARLEKLAAEIAEARADVKAGRVYTSEQVRKILGL